MANLRPKVWGKTTVAKFMYGQVFFNLSGDQSQEDYIKNLDGIIARSSDLTPALQRVGRYLMGSTLRTFQAEGRPRKWQRLAPRTLEDRRKKGFSAGPILDRTGTLKRSLTQPGAKGSIFIVGPRSLRYGSSILYFETHQKGDPTRNIPKRAMLVIQRQDRSQISRIMNTHVRGDSE